MKAIFVAAALAAAAMTSPVFGADVGISISVNQPGFYGQVNIGDTAPPVIYNQPVIVNPHPVEGAPIYLHVPPGYEKHWSMHCHEYHACGRRVYFVQDKWFRRDYARRHHQQYREERRDERRGHERSHHGKDHRGGSANHDYGYGRGDDY